MRATKTQSKRIPRKLKKEIIKVFGIKIYKLILNSQAHIGARIIADIGNSGWKYKFTGYCLMFTIIDK